MDEYGHIFANAKLRLMNLKQDAFDLLGVLLTSTDLPPKDSYCPCPVNQKNCSSCLLEAVLAFRIGQVEDRFVELIKTSEESSFDVAHLAELTEIKGVQSFSNFSPKALYVSKILSLLRLLSFGLRDATLVTNSSSSTANADLFSIPERRLLSFAFDAFFYVEVSPLLPEGIVSSLDSVLPSDSVLCVSTVFSHGVVNDEQRIKLLDQHFHLLLETFRNSKSLFEEFVFVQNGKRFEDLVGVLGYLSESVVAKQILGERSSSWLKVLEDEVLKNSPAQLTTRILLSNLNKCTSRSHASAHILYAPALYGRLLSKSLLRTDGVQNFLEVFMETSAGRNATFEQLSQEELWKRSLAVAAVLIRCPMFMKPSEYYSNIVEQLVGVMDRCRGKNSFPSFVLASIAIQSHFAEKKNTSMAQKLSRILRLYFFPQLVAPFLRLDPNFQARLPSLSETEPTPVDVVSLARLSDLATAIPEAVWSHLDVGDIHFLVRSFTPFALELSIAFSDNVLLPQLAPLCQKIVTRFLKLFPLVPSSQSVDVLSDWLLRPALPKQFEFERPLVMSAESTQFHINIIPRDMTTFDEVSFIENRFSSIQKLLSSILDRNEYVCAVWSLFLSSMRRLLLFLEPEEHDEAALCLIYTLLGFQSEEVAECTEEELSSLMVESGKTEIETRFVTFVDFVCVLCDRIVILSRDEETTLDPKNSGIFESTISVSMSIISSVLVSKPNDPAVQSALTLLQPKLEPLCTSKLISSQCQEIIKAFVDMLEEGNEKKASSAKVNPTFVGLKCDDLLKAALTHIADPMCAVKGHGLILARRALESKSAIAPEIINELFRMFFQCLSHEDTYVHLNAAAAFTSLGLRFHQQVLPALAALYSGRSCDLLGDKNGLVNVDVRLRIGECLCRIIRGLGEMAPVYRDVLLDACLVAAKSSFQLNESDEDGEDSSVRMRASALSTLGQLTGALRLSLASNSGEVLTCIAGFLTSRSEHLEIRRAAACSLGLLLQGFVERSHIFALADVLRDVGRILRASKAACLDEVLMLHIDFGLAEIYRLGRLLLQPEHELRTVIKSSATNDD